MQQRKWIVIEKEVGQTPLQAIEAFKRWYPGYEGARMAYAGRLDPMASGKLLVLVGDECKKQQYYHTLDKTYEIEIVLGLRSDSGDVLGLIEPVSVPEYERNKLIGVVRSFHGRFEEPYPHFSSKTVQGRPLFEWALLGKLDEIEIPRQHGYIYDITVDKIFTATGTELTKTALGKIHSLPNVTDESKQLGADFRRGSVTATWEHFEREHAQDEYAVVKLTVTCSSGTYMRSLAEAIGSKMDTGALALSIDRSKIGRLLWLPWGLSFWMRTFTR